LSGSRRQPLRGRQPEFQAEGKMSNEVNGEKKLTRRQFMGSTAATAAGFMILKPQQIRGTQANSALRVGLLGCGGRGHADTDYLVGTGECRVTALADLFQDQLDAAKDHFDKLMASKNFSAIEKSQIFRGPKAYEQIANSKDVDIVVITTPPFFHPQHLEAVVLAGKHVYCEKPVAVDAAGAGRVLEAGRRAEGRLSLEVGFQLRNCPPYVEQVKRIHAGALGTIASGEGYYFSSYLDRPNWPGASTDEWMIRNWVYYRVLSGDIIVEQNIHVIDMCNWILQGRPVRAAATGGRQLRPDRGDAYGHYSVVFYYPNGVSMIFGSTQTNKGWWDVAWRFFGSKGVSETHYSGPVAIYGENPWKWDTANAPLSPESKQFSAAGVFHDNLEQADPEKKKSFVESIRSGKFHNQAAQGVESALSCMLARRAAYSGEEITWEAFANSGEHWELPIDLNQFA
jgi:myo-inositol 2-dehydrogenase / D-chiro-inositol 1-dehydrogenase